MPSSEQNKAAMTRAKCERWPSPPHETPNSRAVLDQGRSLEPSGYGGEAPGGSRRRREAKSDTPLSYNAKSSLKCQFDIVFLRVPFTLTAYLQ